jgi:uncharacterized membrane protein YcaP (DUF421 family)
MANWLQPDWYGMFVPSMPLPEIFLRGTLVYLALFILLRVLLKRQAGNVSLTDMLLIVLIADASQNAMAKDYQSVPDGILLVATLIFWDYALDWLSYRIPWLHAFVHPAPLLLIRDGEILKQNLRRELITPEQLESKVRQQGVDDLRQVREAYLEGDGHISVIKKEDSGAAGEEASPASGEKPGEKNGTPGRHPGRPKDANGSRAPAAPDEPVTKAPPPRPPGRGSRTPPLPARRDAIAGAGRMAPAADRRARGRHRDHQGHTRPVRLSREYARQTGAARLPG